VAVWFTAFASTALTPGRRRNADSTTPAEVAQCKSPTFRVVLVVVFTCPGFPARRVFLSGSTKI
jgi:hypothetical protein